MVLFTPANGKIAQKIPVAILASDWVGTELQPASKILSTPDCFSYRQTEAARLFTGANVHGVSAARTGHTQGRSR